MGCKYFLVAEPDALKSLSICLRERVAVDLLEGGQRGKLEKQGGGGGCAGDAMGGRGMEVVVGGVSLNSPPHVKEQACQGWRSVQS